MILQIARPRLLNSDDDVLLNKCNAQNRKSSHKSITNIYPQALKVPICFGVNTTYVYARIINTIVKIELTIN